MKARVAALILAVCPGFGQVPAVRGPVLGYVYDSAGLRPVFGMPGAAVLGQPLNLGGPIAQAAVSPRQDLALAVASSDSTVLVVNLPSGSATACECAPGPDRIVFSPGGDAAALYYSAGSSVRILKGTHAKSAGVFELSLLNGKLTALSVSDAGEVLAAFSEDDGSSGSAYFLSPGSAPRPVLSLRHASAAAFMPGSTDAILADDLDNRIYVVRDPGGAAAVTVVATASDGIDGPVAVRAAGNSRALTANSHSGTITITDLTGGGSSAIECGCTPSQIEPLSSSVYRLTTAPGPIRLLEGDGPGARVAFIPPDSPAPAKADRP